MIFLQDALAFLVTLGILVTIHEFGHYLVARWCGVKVLRFSLGVGKIVYSKRLGKDQTEWAISLLPLGGYVKMLDARESGAENILPEELPREFCQQPVWKRIAIVSAGPVANFLLAIFLFAVLFSHGMSDPVARVRVPSGKSIAYEAGLRNGDLITGLNNQKVRSWSDFRWKLMLATMSGNGLNVQVLRTSTDHKENTTSFSIALPLDELNAQNSKTDLLTTLGFGLSGKTEVILDDFLPGSAALKAGLRSGDRILEVDHKPLLDSVDFQQVINANPGRALNFLVQRNQETFNVMVTPASVSAGKAIVGRINASLSPPEMTLVQDNAVDAVKNAAVRTWESSYFSLKAIGKMVVGKLSLKNITGVLTIADYAGKTSRASLFSYLSFIASVSISLGVMNLLPIPVLDGGHLLYYSLEVLTGKPLPDRYVEMGQRVGVFLLLTMMVIAFFNDIARLMS